jgi:ATP-dependent RNA circularization protein (DNA/RNA ligase family)
MYCFVQKIVKKLHFMDELDKFLLDLQEKSTQRVIDLNKRIYKIESSGMSYCSMKKKFLLDTLFLNNNISEVLNGNDKSN